MFGQFSQLSVARGTARAAIEFVVIVAGVLVALSAEEWLHSRADSTLESEYLERLSTDVRADIGRWAAVDRRLERKNAALRGVEIWLRSPDRTEEALRQLVADLVMGAFLAYGAGTDAQRATFDELVSTGRLQLLRETELRSALISYYGEVDLQRIRVIARETAYAPAIYELVPNDAEFEPRKGLTIDDLVLIADNTTNGNVGGLATAELNRGLMRRQVTGILSSRSASLLRLLADQLDRSE